MAFSHCQPLEKALHLLYGLQLLRSFFIIFARINEAIIQNTENCLYWGGLFTGNFFQYAYTSCSCWQMAVMSFSGIMMNVVVPSLFITSRLNSENIQRAKADVSVIVREIEKGSYGRRTPKRNEDIFICSRRYDSVLGVR